MTLPFDEDFQSDTSEAGETLAYKLLIVDDEEVVRDVLAMLLERDQDLALTMADSAERALELLRAEHFHVLITDKNLPGIGGIELIQRAKEQRPLLEAIMITGYASAESVIAALSAGASDYLTKPFEDLKVVHAKVRAALGRRQEQVRFRERAHEVAREASGLLEQGRDAPEPEWKKLEAQLAEYERAIRHGGAGRVRVVGDPEILQLLNGAGVDSQPSAPEAPELANADVVVIETNVAGWRALAERLRSEYPDVVLAAKPGAGLDDLLDAIALKVPLVGFGGQHGNLPDQVTAVLRRRRVERAQEALAMALAEFREVLAR